MANLTSALCAVLAFVPIANAQGACSADGTDLFLNPFNKASAHHRPIGTGAIYAADDHPATADWLKSNVFNVNIGTPFGTDVAATTASDPIISVGPKATCDKVSGLPAAIRLPIGGINSILKNNPNGCPDGDVVVFDRTTGRPHQLRQFTWNDGSPMAGQYRSFDIQGMGHGTRRNERLGTAATGVAGLFGVLRGHEVNTPGYKIEHALRMGIPRKAGCKIMLSREIVLPATSRDKGASNPSDNTGHIPYGGLLALPQTVNVEALGLSEAGTRLARAVQQYGIYVGDGGGRGAGALEADQMVSSALKRVLRKDIMRFYPLMRLVLNNDVLGSPTVGGGEPIGDNCAFDAQP